MLFNISFDAPDLTNELSPLRMPKLTVYTMYSPNWVLWLSRPQDNGKRAEQPKRVVSVCVCSRNCACAHHGLETSHVNFRKYPDPSTCIRQMPQVLPNAGIELHRRAIASVVVIPSDLASTCTRGIPSARGLRQDYAGVFCRTFRPSL